MEQRITPPRPPRGGVEPRARASRAAQEAALARLVDEHGDAVWRLARSVVHDSALADDVVQETMVKAWRALADWEGDEIPRAWLMKVARNTAISMLRARREMLSEPADLVAEPAGGSGTGAAATDRVAVEHLWEALAELDETSRSVVVMRELSQMSYEEISEVLDIPLPTVKTRLFRARRTVQAAMEGWRT